MEKKSVDCRGRGLRPAFVRCDLLLSKVWGYDYFGDLRTVDTHIKKLRSKLGERAVHIKTLIKAGYKFEE